VGGAALALALIVATLVAWDTLALRRDLNRARAAFDQALAITDPVVTNPASFRDAAAVVEAASFHLLVAESALASAERRTARLGPLLWAGSLLPGWPRGLGEVAPLVETAHDLARAGVALSEGLTSLSARLDQPATPDTPASLRFVAGLSTAEADFQRALAFVDRAITSRQAVASERLRGPLAPAARALATLDGRFAAARDDLALLAQLPAATRALLGMDGPRTYLVLGQDSAELRPTGGFIGLVGLLKVDAGRITSQEFRGSYTFDNPARGFDPLPAPMAAHMGGGGWTLRDANWSPDFPTSALKAEALLRQQQDISVDGVIAFTNYTVSMLLDALGPLSLEGFAQPLTGSNWYEQVIDRIYYINPNQSAPREQAERSKGEVLSPLLRAIIDRMQQMSVDELPRLVTTLQKAAEQRELLVYMHDPAANGLARRSGADGRLVPPEGGDVLAVVDANLSFSKAGPYVRQRTVYEVWLNERGVAEQSRLSVAYENTVPPALHTRVWGVEWDALKQDVRGNDGVYGTYTRVYIPRNSRLLALDTPPPLLGSDLGFTTLERYHSIAAGSNFGLSYGYQIPTDLNRPGSYRLRVFKQPGTMGYNLEIRVHLPAGVEADTNLAVTREGDALVYRGTLHGNLDFALTLR